MVTSNEGSSPLVVDLIPLHLGHIDYLEGAKQLGDKLIVALNSDEWFQEKKAGLMSFQERARILETMDMVDNVWGSDDKDGPAVYGLKNAQEGI